MMNMQEFVKSANVTPIIIKVADKYTKLPYEMAINVTFDQEMDQVIQAWRYKLSVGDKHILGEIPAHEVDAYWSSGQHNPRNCITRDISISTMVLLQKCNVESL